MSGRKYIGPWSAQPVGSLADISLHTQNAAIAPVNIFGGTPVAKGLYRVTLCFTVQTAGTAGTASTIIGATGENGSNTFALPDADLTARSMQAASFQVSADGTSDIFYTVVMTGLTAGSLAYSLRVVVEQLTNQA